MKYSIHRFNFHILVITFLMPFWLFAFVQFEDIAEYLRLDMNNDIHAAYVKNVMSLLKFSIQSAFLLLSTAFLFKLPVKEERKQLFDHKISSYIFTPIVFFMVQSPIEAYGWAIFLLSLYCRGVIIHHFLEYYKNK